MSRSGKIVRGVIGVIVVVTLLIVVNNWWRAYRHASPSTSSSVTTQTPTATSTAPASTASRQTVLVIIEGLNFRSKPDATGTSIRGLKKGEHLVIVGKTGTWLQLQDANGTVGWVHDNPQYLKIVKSK